MCDLASGSEENVRPSRLRAQHRSHNSTTTFTRTLRTASTQRQGVDNMAYPPDVVDWRRCGGLYPLIGPSPPPDERGREAAVTALVMVLVGVVVVLAALVAVGLILVLKVVRPLSRSDAAPAVEDSAQAAERDRQEQSLAALRDAADEATSAVDAARALATTARTEAAAAKAEATAARAEAQRVLTAAHAEADTILERAHRQAEQDAEQARLTARRTGEREITMLTATAREQSADAERRQHRLDERERLLVEEAERLAERDRRISATELDLGDRETSLGARERILTELEEDRRRELERIAGLTADGARQELIEMIETHAQTEAALLVRDNEADARGTAEQRARHIVVDA